MSKEKAQTSSPLKRIIEEAEQERVLPTTPPHQTQEESSSQQQTSEQTQRIIDSWILNTPLSSTKGQKTTEKINEVEVQSELEPEPEPRPEQNIEQQTKQGKDQEMAQPDAEVTRQTPLPPPHQEQEFEEVMISLYGIYRTPKATTITPISLRRVKLTKKIQRHPSGIEIKLREVAKNKDTDMTDVDKEKDQEEAEQMEKEQEKAKDDQARPSNTKEDQQSEEEEDYVETINDHLHEVGLRMQMISDINQGRE